MGIRKFSRIVSQKGEDPRRSDFSGAGFATNAVLEIFLKNENVSDDRTFSPQWIRYHSTEMKSFIEKSSAKTTVSLSIKVSPGSLFAKSFFASNWRSLQPPSPSRLAPPLVTEKNESRQNNKIKQDATYFCLWY